MTTLKWPREHVTSIENEHNLIDELLPLTEPDGLSVLRGNLPPHVEAEIECLGSERGFSQAQVFALRRNLLKAILGQKAFHALGVNSQQTGKAMATAFEQVVHDFVQSSCPGIEISTEAHRLALLCPGEPLPPNPDFTFDPPIHVKGHTVHWIDAKNMYGCFEFRTFPWQSENKMQERAARYNELYGPGAYVFANGFCNGLRKYIRGALLLDATELDQRPVSAACVAADLAGALQQTSIGASSSHEWGAAIMQIGSMACQKCDSCGAIAQRRRITKTRCEWTVLRGPKACNSAR